MRIAFAIVLSLFFVQSLPADPNSAGSLNPKTAHFYVNPLRLITLSDGAHFVIYQPRSKEAEPQAMTGITIDARTGEAVRAFFVSKWLGDEMLEGTFGQIYAATLLTPRGKSRWMAISVGYADHSRRAKHAILNLRETADGTWRLGSRIPIAHTVGDIAATSDGGILAVVYDEKGQLSVRQFDREDRPGKQWFTKAVDASIGSLAVIRARIQALGNDRFAYHDGLSDKLVLFAPGEATAPRTITVAALRDDEDIRRLRGWHVYRDGSLSVIRAVREGNALRAVMFELEADGTARAEVVIEPPASFFWQDDALHATYPRGRVANVARALD